MRSAGSELPILCVELSFGLNPLSSSVPYDDISLAGFYEEEMCTLRTRLQGVMSPSATVNLNVGAGNP